MKSKKTKIAVIVLLIVLIAAAIAYASFNGVLNIQGKATAGGNFEVIFTNGTVSTSEHGTAVVNATDNTKMTVNVELKYPGDGCYVTATIKNNGSVPAELKSFNLYNAGTKTAFSNEDIDVIVPSLSSLADPVLQPNATTTVTFTVKWKTASTKQSAEANFDIELDYEQATTEVTERSGFNID